MDRQEAERVYDTCRQPLSQTLLDPARQPLRHQAVELPPIIPVKTEYRLHSLLCSCGRHTIARLPKGLSTPTSARESRPPTPI